MGRCQSSGRTVADPQEPNDADDDEATASTALKGAEDSAEGSPFPEGGYGWVVVAACLLGQFLAIAPPLYYGAFYLEFLDYFEESKMLTAWIGSISYGMFAGSGPLAGFICNLIGHRKACFVGAVLATSGYLTTAFATSLPPLFFCYGVLIGSGCGMIYVVTLVYPSLYFKKRRGLAYGISTTGSSIGLLTFPLLEQYLIDEYTWRGAAILLAGISLHLCICGAFIRPNPKLRSEFGQARPKGRELFRSILSSANIFKGVKFPLAVLASTLEGVYWGIYFSVLTDRLVNYGYNRTGAAVFMTISGISGVFARLASGIITSFFPVNTVLLYGVNMFIISLAPAVLVLDRLQYGVLVAVFLVNGANQGIRGAFIGNYAVTLAGIKHATAGVGYMVMGEGIGAFIGPPVAGHIFDMTGSYKMAFILAFGLCLFASLLNIPVYLLHRRSSEKHSAIS